MTLTKALLTLLIFSLTMGCASLSDQSDSERHSGLWPDDSPVVVLEDDLTPSSEETSPHPSEFSKDTLYQLLVAEVAGQRGDLKRLVDQYSTVAKETRDSGVVKRAVNAALHAKSDQHLTEMAMLWSELEPENVEAHQLVAFQFIKAKEYPRALAHMETVLELEGPTTFDRLALHAKSLGKEEKSKLLGLYFQILDRHPNNEELLYGYAILQELNGEYEAALASTDKLLLQAKSNPAVIALRARLLKQVKGLDASLNYLQAETHNHPKEMQVGALYGRTLIEARQLAEAQQVYNGLMQTFPDASHLQLSFSLIALENKQPGVAKKHLQQLLERGQHVSEAHFYLGRIADQAEQPEEAIFHYQQVAKGNNFFDSLARSSYLLIEQGRADEVAINFSNARQNLPDQAGQLWELEISLMSEVKNYNRAIELADFALEENPDNLNLRYTRAMIRDRQGLYAEMEQDLRIIIAKDPEHSIALNALGYTLADKTERLDEAYELISKALNLDPDNPAILDSMGWVLYRMGNLQRSLGYLQKAYTKFPDPEVAAHLGEVLWMLGNQQKALQVWQQAYEKEPEHPILTKTLERLSIEL